MLDLSVGASEYLCTSAVKVDGVVWFIQGRNYRLSQSSSHQGDIRIRAVDLKNNEEFTFECLVTDAAYSKLLKSFEPA